MARYKKGTRDAQGNPYCYLMGDYVRLASRNEMMDFWVPLMKHDSGVKKLYIDGINGHISTAEFARRMSGRSLNDELELAGITNIDAVKNEEWESEASWVAKVKTAGLAFEYQRWGKKYGAQLFPDKESRQNMPELARYKNNGPWYWDHWLYENKDYIIMSPEFIMWDMSRNNYTGYGDSCYCPNGALNVYYNTEGSGASNISFHEYWLPMTFLVKVNK